MARSFELLRTLGQGAYGVVHLAEVREEEGFVQTLAVKLLHPHCAQDEPIARRLRDEARLLGLLHHDHIVRVHGLTRVDGRLAILMEPVEGADLSRLAQGMPPRAALEVMAAVADALDAAWHAVPEGRSQPLRVVHRDIKPSNVMVTARGGTKVMDFGVARATFDSREAETRSQQLGTARYMAPERWLTGEAGAPSDVFSLGITLVEILGGQPVERLRLSPEVFEEDLGEALAGLVAWPEIKDLAEAMCSYDPEARPEAAEVVTRCRQLASALAGPDLREWAEAWVPSVRVDAEPTGTATGTVVVEDAPSAATSPSRVRLALVGGALVVAVLVPGLWLASQEPPQPEPVVVLPEPEPAPELTLPEPEEGRRDEPAGYVGEETTTTIQEPAPASRRDEPAGYAGVRAPPPPEEPAPVELPEAYISFVLDPADLAAQVHGQPVRPRRAQALSEGVHEVVVGAGDDRWTCTVVAADTPRTYRISAAERRCTRSE